MTIPGLLCGLFGVFALVSLVFASSAYIASLHLAERHEKAMDLLARATDWFEDSAPDSKWFSEYFELTEEHMVLTEEGWQPGSEKATLVAEYGDDYISDEVNAPNGGRK